eukprot:jgi/Chlat1/7455/Chrsp6S07498
MAPTVDCHASKQRDQDHPCHVGAQVHQQLQSLMAHTVSAASLPCSQLRALSGEQRISSGRSANRRHSSKRTLVRAAANNGEKLNAVVNNAKKAVSLGLTALLASTMPLMAAPQAAKDKFEQVKGADEQGMAQGRADFEGGNVASALKDRVDDLASNINNPKEAAGKAVQGDFGGAVGKVQSDADEAPGKLANDLGFGAGVAGGLVEKVKDILPGNPLASSNAPTSDSREEGVAQGKADANSGNVFSALKERVGDVASNIENPKEAAGKAVSGDIGGAVGKVKSDAEAAPGKLGNDIGFGQGVVGALGDKVKEGLPLSPNRTNPLGTSPGSAYSNLDQGVVAQGSSGGADSREAGVAQGKDNAKSGNVFSALKERVGDVASNTKNPREAVGKVASGDIGGAAGKVKSDMEAAPGRIGNDFGFGQGIFGAVGDKIKDLVSPGNNSLRNTSFTPGKDMSYSDAADGGVYNKLLGAQDEVSAQGKSDSSIGNMQSTFREKSRENMASSSGPTGGGSDAREAGVAQGKEDAKSGNVFSALKERVGDVVSNLENPKEAVGKAAQGDIGGAVGKVKSDAEAAPGKVGNDLGFGQGVVGALGDKVKDLASGNNPLRNMSFTPEHFPRTLSQ